MASHITVILRDRSEHEFELSDADLASLNSAQAAEWLDSEFFAGRGAPNSMVGKLLLLDKILVLAVSQLDAAFTGPTPWVREFLCAAAVALDRPRITIDLSKRSISY